MKKTLIVYASKTGNAKEAAKMMAKRLGDCDLYDCRSKTLTDVLGAQKTVVAPAMESYRVIVCGTAMRMGAPLREMKQFLAKYAVTLRAHPLVFYTCGVGDEQEDGKYMRDSLPQSLREIDAPYRHLGCELRLERMNIFDRFAMAEYKKKHGPTRGVDRTAADALCDAIQKATKFD